MTPPFICVNLTLIFLIMSIRENIRVLQEKIYKAAGESGRRPSEIIVVCVSKNRAVEDVCEVLDSGINYIAENRIQEAQVKYPGILAYAKEKNISLNFHMVGHLQTNKVNKALDIFSLIHSVDSFRLLQKINEVSASKGNITEVLLEVNVSGEKSKFGINSSEAIDFLKEASGLDSVYVRGLMTVAPLVKNKNDARPYFNKLRQLKDKIREMGEPFFKGRVKMDFLSMGMSQDYEAAIQEGSNMLRIGSAIFEGE